MAVEFGTAKTVLILAIVVGCFAVLWPKLFYPMLQASVNPRPSGESQACCDVLFENDVNAIKVINELCGSILHQYDEFDPTLTQTFNQGKLTKDVVNTCRNEVLNKCGIDITSFLNEKVRLGKSYKQILDEIRSFNSSVCLKLNFGINLGTLGAPRRMRLGVLSTPKHFRQERPPHLRPDMLHPALRERGRAIPQSHIVPRTVEKEPRPPIPGMRPPMGGAGHVVPAPKGSSTMGIIMPIYTIGIVIFFMYTIMKVIFKKSSDTTSTYTEFSPDPEFRKIVFENYGERSFDDGLKQRPKLETGPPWKTKDDGTKLGDIEIDHLRRRLEETEAAMERIVAQMGSVPRKLYSSSGTDQNRAKEENKLEEKSGIYSSQKEIDKNKLGNVDEIIKDGHQAVEVTSSPSPGADSQVDKVQTPDKQIEPTTQEGHKERPSSRAEEEGGAKVKVMGMETTASCECGHRWSRPSTPILGIPGHGHSRSSTPVPPPTPEPTAIYLEGSLPSQSKLLVSDAETQAMALDVEDIEEDLEPQVILSGKMTLSLISLDAALAAEDEQLRQQQGEKSIAAEAETAAIGDSEVVRAAAVNIEKADEEVEEEEEEVEEEEEDEEEEAKENDENAGGEQNASEEEKKSEERRDIPLVNDTQHDHDDTPSATNYTTASAAAEAANASGTEETAADFSTMESFGIDDEQQDDLEEEEEVWNGDIHSGEEDQEDNEDDNEPHIPHPHQHH